jgi:hypothetical protein
MNSRSAVNAVREFFCRERQWRKTVGWKEAKPFLGRALDDVRKATQSIFDLILSPFKNKPTTQKFAETDDAKDDE